MFSISARKNNTFCDHCNRYRPSIVVFLHCKHNTAAAEGAVNEASRFVNALLIPFAEGGEGCCVKRIEAVGGYNADQQKRYGYRLTTIFELNTGIWPMYKTTKYNPGATLINSKRCSRSIGERS